VGYVERHLLPGERVLYKTRLHWAVFIKPALLVLAGVALMALLGPVRDPRWLWMVGGAVALIGLGWGFVHYVEVMTSEFVTVSSALEPDFAQVTASVAARFAVLDGERRLHDD